MSEPTPFSPEALERARALLEAYERDEVPPISVSTLAAQMLERLAWLEANPPRVPAWLDALVSRAANAEAERDRLRALLARHEAGGTPGGDQLAGGEAVSDAVNHPAHYGGENDPCEAIKVIEAWGLGFCLGNAVKYIARAGRKPGADPVEDLKKAVWYLNREIERIKSDGV